MWSKDYIHYMSTLYKGKSDLGVTSERHSLWWNGKTMNGPFLNPVDAAEIRERFATELTQEVKVTLFTRSADAPAVEMPECFSCTETEGLMRELAALSENFVLDVIDIVDDAASAAAADVTAVPTFTVAGTSVRFLGFPAGYEFVAFLETVLSVPKQHHGLDGASIERVLTIDNPVQIKVFSTPT